MLSFLISSCVTLIALIVLRPLSIKINLIDYPIGRKKHTGNIPLVGGISIFFGLLSSHLFEYQSDLIINRIFIFLLFILILGIIDDLNNLKAKTKLIIQIMVVSLTVFYTEIQIESLGYFFDMSL